jgi:hypothetical protein
MQSTKFFNLSLGHQYYQQQIAVGACLLNLLNWPNYFAFNSKNRQCQEEPGEEQEWQF